MIERKDSQKKQPVKKNSSGYNPKMIAKRIDLIQKLLLKCNEIQNKKGKFRLSDVIDYGISHYNVPKSEVIKALDCLFCIGRIIPESYLMEENIADSPTRNKIINLLKEYPALSLKQFDELLNLERSIFFWHIKILMNFNLVYGIKVAGIHIFYLNVTPTELAKVYFLVNSNIIIRNIFANLLKEEKTAKQLFSILNISKNVLAKYLSLLLNLEILLKVNNGYLINKKYKSLIEKALSMKQYFKIKTQMKYQRKAEKSLVTQEVSKIKDTSDSSTMLPKQMQLTLQEFHPELVSGKYIQRIKELQYQIDTAKKLMDDLILFTQRTDITDDEKKQADDKIKEYTSKIKELEDELNELSEKNINEIKDNLRLAGENLVFIWILNKASNNEIFYFINNKNSISVEEKQYIQNYLSKLNIEDGIFKRIGVKINNKEYFILQYASNVMFKFFFVFKNNINSVIFDDIKMQCDWFEPNYISIKNDENTIIKFMKDLFFLK
ncbi:MAG: hypothetical protein ACTSRZ_18470 [Promethearchaeota archaeon]